MGRRRQQNNNNPANINSPLQISPPGRFVNPFGQPLTLINYCGATSGDTLGSLLGHWGHFGFTLGSFWDHFGVMLGSCWGHLGYILGTLFRGSVLLLFRFPQQRECLSKKTLWKTSGAPPLKQEPLAPPCWTPAFTDGPYGTVWCHTAYQSEGLTERINEPPWGRC